MTLQDGLREGAEFLEEPFAEVWNRYQQLAQRHPGSHLKWIYATEQEWLERVDPTDKQQVENFYRTSTNLLFELLEGHATEGRQFRTKWWIDYALKQGATTACDFGCGIAQDSIAAAQAGLAATAVDLLGVVFEFAQHRVSAKGVSVEFIPSHSFIQTPPTFDVVTCFEVLQHVCDVDEVLSVLAQSVRSAGLLFVTTRFVGNYALALTQYEGLEDITLIEPWGFEIERSCELWPGKMARVFRKVG